MFSCQFGLVSVLWYVHLLALGWLLWAFKLLNVTLLSSSSLLFGVLFLVCGPCILLKKSQDSESLYCIVLNRVFVVSVKFGFISFCVNFALRQMMVILIFMFILSRQSPNSESCDL